MDPVKSMIRSWFCRGILDTRWRLVCTANTEGMETDVFLQVHLTKLQQFWRQPNEPSNAHTWRAGRRWRVALKHTTWQTTTN